MSPAIGAGGRLPRRVLVRRQAFAAALVLLLIGAKVLIAPDVIDAATVTRPDRVVTPGLMIGSAPADSDLVEFAVGLQVDGVVNLAAPSVAEQVTAASLHQAYLYLPVPPGLAPTPPQLRRLAGFVRRYTERGAWVYVHDDVGGTRAVTAAAMLLLLRGQTWAAVSAEITLPGLKSLGGHQRLALERLRSTLHRAGPSRPANPAQR